MRYRRPIVRDDLRSLYHRDFRGWLSRSFAEPLETRQLLAAAVYVSNGTLFVDGTEGDDTISVTVSRPNYSNQVVVVINSVAFDPIMTTDLSGVRIRGFGGNDSINHNDTRPGVNSDHLSTTIDGGDGNDSITPINADSVIGGNGDDTLLVGGDQSYNTPSIAFDGGAGTDTIAVTGGYGYPPDLRLYPTVENVTSPFGGTYWGNDLNNRITLTGGSTSVVHAGGGNDTVNAGPGNDTLYGDAGNDSLLGNSGDDSLDGGTGADIMKGGAGRDTVDYATRTAKLNISLDNLANDGELNEKDNVWTDVEVIHGGSNADVIHGGPGNERIVGNGGNDSLYGGGGNDTITGDAGNDSLFGEAGNDQLIGGAGNDTLDGGTGTDTLDGGAGANILHNGETNIANSSTALLANRVLTIIGSTAEDVFNIHPSLVNGQSVVRAFGTNYNVKDFDYIGLNLLDGNDYAEIFNVAISVVGGNGNDTIFTHQSSDPTYAPGTLNVLTFDGGSGTDLYRTDTGGTLDLRKSPTVENAYFNAQGAHSGTLYGNALSNNLDLFNVFNFTAYGLGGNDSIHAATAGGTIDAGDGDDAITVDYYGNFTLKGGNGNDTIINQSDACLMQGGPGNDTLIGGLEGDTLDGGTGADYLDGGDDDIDQFSLNKDVIDYSSRTAAVSVAQDGIANDGEAGEGDNVIGMSIILGGSGNDLLDGRVTFSSSQGYVTKIVGNAGNDKIIGPPANDYYYGQNIGSSLLGGTGNDTIQGGSGDDLLDGGTGADVLQGGGGFDTVDYSARTANLTVSVGNNAADDGETGEHDNVAADIEKVIGGSGNDLLRGSSANNVLLGLGGNDTLFGGGGNDALFGGSGNDQLNGEAGNDYLEGQAGADTLNGGDGVDTALADAADLLIAIESLK